MIVAYHQTPVGKLALVSNGTALVGIYFEQHKPGGVPKDATPGADKITQRTARALDAYFSGARGFDLPIAFKGTDFQQRVWRALTEIPYGATTTYGALAKTIGSPAAVRAVGAAVGRNPLSIIVPCHRVVGASGALTGFAGGVERKRTLLALEAERARRAA